MKAYRKCHKILCIGRLQMIQNGNKLHDKSEMLNILSKNFNILHLNKLLKFHLKNTMLTIRQKKIKMYVFYNFIASIINENI